MTYPLRSSPSPNLRSRLARSPVIGDGEPLAWNRSAATAVAVGRDAQGAAVYVQALCWPIVPNAWALLQEAWAIVRSGRQSVAKEALTAPLAPTASWIGESAPQLSSPFRGSQAEESSVAALVARTPIQIGLGVCTSGQDPEAALRQTWSECLGAYGEYLRIPGRSPCTAVVTQGSDGDRQSVDALLRTRVRMSDQIWLQELRLQFAREDEVPLPLEMAAVVARSVSEHLVGGPTSRAVLDVSVAKLTRVPDSLKRPLKSGKRR